MRRPRLTRERIAEAALRLADRDGLDALSMRRLGRDLGVEAMSLYEHVAGKDDILDDVLDLLLGNVELPAPAGREWDDVVRDLFVALRRRLLEYPGAVPLLATRAPRSVDALAPIEVSLGVLRRAGFGRQAAIDAHRVLWSFTVGYVLSECGATPGAAAQSAVGTGAQGAGVDQRAELPYVGEVVAVAPGRQADEQFDFSLAVILTGLRAMRPSPSEQGDGPACGL